MHLWLSLVLLLAPHAGMRVSQGPKQDDAVSFAKEPRVHDRMRRPTRSHVRLVEEETIQTGAQFDRAAMVQSVERRRGRLQFCFDHELRTDAPPRAGRVVVSLRVNSDGTVRNVRLPSNGTGNRATAACVLQEFRGFRFSPPPVGNVHFTLTLEYTLR